ncbi:hypothetical protein FRC03_012498 [Tulasnella sp. 419]|nr:hypothetical protein FRC03_012498 [Tulasnella sp. 419]
MVVLSDAQEMEDIFLRSRSKHLECGTRVMNIVKGITPKAQIALTMDDLWKKHRRLGTSVMSTQFLRRVTPRVADGAVTLVNYWKEKMTVVHERGGSCFDCASDFHLCTMDIITELSFAEKVDGILSAQSSLRSTRVEMNAHGGVKFPDLKGNKFHQAVTAHYVRMTRSMKIPPILMSLYWQIVSLTPAFRADNRTIRDAVIYRVQQARVRAVNVGATGGSEIPDCALDLIIEKDEKDGAERYKEDEIVDETVDYLFAGYDTTASTLTFAVKYLTNNPSVQFKLHEELTSNLVRPENRPLTYEEVASGNRTPYLEAVVHEVLRHALVSFAVVREVVEDTVIMGRHIPKGTEVLFLTGLAGFRATKSWGAQRTSESSSFKPSKGFWDDEDTFQFKPERWLVDGPDGNPVFSINQGYSIPFGLGPKSCFGQKLALLELKVIIATLSLAFFFDKIPDELNGNGYHEVLTRKPNQSYVSLLDWEDINGL